MTGGISPRFWGGTFPHETSQKRGGETLTRGGGSGAVWGPPGAGGRAKGLRAGARPAPDEAVLLAGGVGGALAPRRRIALDQARALATRAGVVEAPAVIGAGGVTRRVDGAE